MRSTLFLLPGVNDVRRWNCPVKGTHLTLPEEGDCGGIWNVVHHAKPDKLLKGASVIHLEFKIVIAEVEKLLENEHLEKDQRINPLAPCIALAFLSISLVKKWAE